MLPLIQDPWFYAAAVPAVFLIGLSKGGLGGAMGFVGVPLMSLTMSPVQAAAILLPIMCFMDLISLWTWRGYYNRQLLLDMMPGAMAGIALGWLTAAMVTADEVRLLVGIIAITFVGRWLVQLLLGSSVRAAPRNVVAANFWGLLSGFTSFVAHVGGPPFQVYALSLRLDPKIFTGTSVIFFAVMNGVKLVPYFALGQFDAANLTASAALMPVAPVATLLGAWAVKRMRPALFYPLTYVTVGIVSVKLVWDFAFTSF